MKIEDLSAVVNMTIDEDEDVDDVRRKDEEPGWLEENNGSGGAYVRLMKEEYSLTLEIATPTCTAESTKTTWILPYPPCTNTFRWRGKRDLKE